MRAAIIGTGHIASSYARTLRAHGARITACLDVNPARAERFAARWDSVAVTEPAGLRRHSPDVAINLTPPREHGSVTETLLDLGIPVYTEKPLAHELGIARALVARSDERGIALMCAPDTLFGGPQQQLRRLVDAGLIGRPLLLHGQMAWSGHETWHPRPQMFYQRGAGPLLDLGPYWVTTMLDLAGPAVAVTAVDASPGTGGGGRAGAEVPLTVAVLIEFRSGAVGTLAMSFDWPATTAPPLQILGEKGSLICDMPMFEGRGTVRYRPHGARAWSVLPRTAPAVPWQRGIGVVHMLRGHDMSESLLGKRRALHILDILQAAADSIGSGARTEVTTVWSRVRE
ncbi:Gfo/Idh/MocA family protein [Nocardia sp. NPDC051750]|uniref:Gfo/Idh/MocA family protein n=1 Tax=Nocardia sp. NPDC051750 TaxID=3364325 RepID=UPI00378A82C4